MSDLVVQRNPIACLPHSAETEPWEFRKAHWSTGEPILNLDNLVVSIPSLDPLSPDR